MAGQDGRRLLFLFALLAPFAPFAPFALLTLHGAGLPLGAGTLRVPGEFPTIAAAVRRASDGDLVLVDDGTYLEKNIILDKAIRIRSRNLFGAVIYGSSKNPDAIFVVRAPVRIEGFVLKGAYFGVWQRGSPDVRWEAANLALINCENGISVDAADGNVGSADIRNVIIIDSSGTSSGIVTNDAGHVDVSGCLVMDCLEGFKGYDHLSFRVADSATIDCDKAVYENDRHRPIPPASSRIDTGAGLLAVRAGELKDPSKLARLMSFVRTSVLPVKEGARWSDRDETARESVLSLVAARIMEKAGDREAASRRYEAARAAAERAGSPELVWQGLWGQARVAGPPGDLEKALAAYGRAIGYLENWHSLVPRGLTRIDFLADKAPAFEAFIGFLLERHRADPSKGYDERAFDCAEMYKSLALSRPPTAAGRPADGAPDRAPGMAAAAKKITEAQRLLQNPDLTAEKKRGLISLLEAAEGEYHDELVGRERAGRDMTPAALPSPPTSPLDLRGVKRKLAGRAVLSYVLGEKASFAFLATEAGLECAELAAGPVIAAMVEPYLRFLQLDDSRDFREIRAGKVLCDAILGPFAARLASLPRRIIVVPDGRLSYVPFETLVVAGPGDEGRRGEKGDGRDWRFLGESAVISYASSVTQALAGSDRAPAGDPADHVLAFGNGGTIRCDNRFGDRKAFYLPLTHVGAEIRSVARALGRRDVTVRLGKEASERSFKAADLGACDIVHIAAHGVIDDVNWWRSALLLAPDPGSVGEDGFLTAWEIAELEVRARLVVLSACSTGAGGLFRGEGIRGLSRAFFRAGAENLVVSLWNVDDKATAAFMGFFYEGIAGGDSPALALAGTKKRMIDTGYANPFYWAPFVLIGRAGEER